MRQAILLWLAGKLYRGGEQTIANDKVTVTLSKPFIKYMPIKELVELAKNAQVNTAFDRLYGKY